MAQTTVPVRWARGQAMASRVDTPIQGLSAAQARPFTVAMPMRRPVKEPGPAATATASISSRVSSLFFSMSATMGIRVRLWVRPVHCQAVASGAPSRSTAQEAALAVVSRARIVIGTPPRW